MAAFDAAASIGIGLILAAVAFFLAREMLGLLLGEAATVPVRRQIIDTVAGFERVDRVIDLRTMHGGPQELLVALDVLFQNGLPSPTKRTVPAYSSPLPNRVAARRWRR
jgi:divalent metal cation (Fe/Co/Zn/Cd) transporter